VKGRGVQLSELIRDFRGTINLLGNGVGQESARLILYDDSPVQM
jgi:hypothetical protein